MTERSNKHLYLLCAMNVVGESIFATTQSTVRILRFPSVILSSWFESLNNICFIIVDASKTAHEIVRLENNDGTSKMSQKYTFSQFIIFPNVLC